MSGHVKEAIQKIEIQYKNTRSLQHTYRRVFNLYIDRFTHS